MPSLMLMRTNVPFSCANSWRGALSNPGWFALCLWCFDLKAAGARGLILFGEHVRRSKTMRALIGTTCEVRHSRKAGRCVTGRTVVECMMSSAASIGIMSPSWTLGKRESDEYFRTKRGGPMCSIVHSSKSMMEYD